MKQQENNKYKPFDLEQAKAGKPVCTRGGHKARIICFDAKTSGNYPIIALIEDSNHPTYETAYTFSNKGEYRKGEILNMDLVMPLEEHEGWINIYKNDGIVSARHIYNTKEEAIESAEGDGYIDTVRVVWHE